MKPEYLKEIHEILIDIYGPEKAPVALEKISGIIAKHDKGKKGRRDKLSQKDMIFITYADSFLKEGSRPLKILGQFAFKYLKDIFTYIHILPFFPFSSDDGFSVIDYYKVAAELGTWDDIHALGGSFKLVFDFVLNHISAGSSWFKKYLENKEGFKDLAISVQPGTDLSEVVRPRSLPLLSHFKKTDGEGVDVWTTFSDDQIDLNYGSIDVLVRMVEVLIFYVKNGAGILRLDAIAYLWKEIGTKCIHLRQTHLIVRLFKLILKNLAPDVLLLTETNVPHEENLSYFGNGSDEADMVYNFSLPPLILYSILSSDSRKFNDWLRSIRMPSPEVCFFNFTASHDGIGVRPVEAILDKEELDAVIRHVENHNGKVSYKKNPDGSESPYELNITYLDALSDDDEEIHIRKFILSQALQLSVPGVPAVYVHSLLGSHNWLEGIRQTGRLRSINREKLDYLSLTAELDNKSGFRGRIFAACLDLIKKRREVAAFSPYGSAEVLDIHDGLISFKRELDDDIVFVLANLLPKTLGIHLTLLNPEMESCRDIITGKVYAGEVLLESYQIVWMK
ncbi:MAG: sugar phosphorylase [Spirochaetales bacterium]|nr:sugar phosphorylase [Spirochaetales bacterium]